MTKFEEEFKALTSWDWVNVDLIQNILTKFGNWHSDEEFQAEKDARKKEYEIHQDIYSKTSKKLNEAELEIANLKSQLQQQALPVVPECVGVVIEKEKQANVSISDVFEATFSYENDHLTEAGLWTKNNPEQYIIARNIGYTVEKPQLFYLKNKLTTSYLALDTNTGYYEHWGEEIIPKSPIKQGYIIAFTQQEIDSMNTGSYEQIEVAE